MQLYLPYSGAQNKPNFEHLSCALTELVDLFVLFILQLSHVSSSAVQLECTYRQKDQAQQSWWQQKIFTRILGNSARGEQWR